MNKASNQHFARQIVLPEIGETGQQRLARANILIIGLGGLGCPAALYLASCGVGRLTLCDHDRIDASNLARQILFTEANIGQPKVGVAASALKQRNPGLSITSHEQRMTTDNLPALVDSCDLVIDASDNYATRVAVNQCCLAATRPWVMGAAIRAEGQLLVLTPGRDDSPCYQCVYGDAAQSLDDCQGAGVVATVTGMIGTAMANAALRLLLKPESVAPTLHLLDAWRMDWRQLKTHRQANCPACAAIRC